jgi:hypothetical protein
MPPTTTSLNNVNTTLLNEYEPGDQEIDLGVGDIIDKEVQVHRVEGDSCLFVTMPPTTIQKRVAANS